MNTQKHDEKEVEREPKGSHRIGRILVSRETKTQKLIACLFHEPNRVGARMIMFEPLLECDARLQWGERERSSAADGRREITFDCFWPRPHRQCETN